MVMKNLNRWALAALGGSWLRFLRTGGLAGCGLVLAMSAAPAIPVLEGGDGAADETESSSIEWNRRNAEHLLNRAGFGATPAQVDAAMAQGLDATIEALFVPAGEVKPFDLERATVRDGAPRPEDMERQDAARQMRRIDTMQLADYSAWWFDTMIAGADPLRDRMMLFWHGYFTSSQRDVRSSYQMAQQNMLLRDNALGSFEDILFGIAKDPAMLEYLDNDENKKDNPNENFAREVMELFTLGEGHYSEDDIKEAARAFTGWRSRRGEFTAQNRQHDSGKKTILGKTGRFDGDDVLELLIQNEHCGPHVAGRILEYLEGNPPSAERKAAYGKLLSESKFDVGAFLRTLFHDPYFYSDAVVGQRVTGPIDYLVGMAHRLDVDPPQVWLTYGSELLGQELFNPPNVKGWPGGMAWITTASFMQRGNLAGILMGVVNVSDLIDDGGLGAGLQAGSDADPDAMTGDGMMTGGADAMDGDAMIEPPDAQQKRRLGQLNRLRRLDRSWNPKFNLVGSLQQAGASTPEAIVEHLADQLLAIELPAETRAYLLDEYTARRTAVKVTGKRFKDRRNEEQLLCSFAHLILSLPEAQLN